MGQSVRHLPLLPSRPSYLYSSPRQFSDGWNIHSEPRGVTPLRRPGGITSIPGCSEPPKFTGVCHKPGIRNASGETGCKGLWLKIKQEGLRRCWSMFPLTRVPFWYRFLEPQPQPGQTLGQSGKVPKDNIYAKTKGVLGREGEF